MKQTEAYLLARSLMDKHELKDWSFGFDTAVRRLGVCFVRRQRIQMSRQFVKLNDEAKVTQVMLHEIAHALCGPFENHGPTWKAKALSIGCENPKSSTTAVMAPARYVTTCPNGHTGHARVRPRKSSRSCGRCSSVYDPKFKLAYTLNPEFVEAMKG